MADEKQEITFGKRPSPDQDAAYRAKIDGARNKTNALKGSEPVGPAAKQAMPDFAALQAQRNSSRSQPFELDPAQAPTSVQPRPAGSPLLSPHTQQQLQELPAAQARLAEEEKSKLDDDDLKKRAAEEKDELLEMAFDFEGRNEAERVLNNKKRRKQIEARCEPMNLSDLIVQDEVRQRVPIRPNEFEVVYRSITPAENLFIKSYMAKESSDKEKSEQYLLEKYSLCQLACALVSINGKELPPHLNKDGDPKEDLFESKLRLLMKKSGYIIADLGVNYSWFDIRVRKLLNPDDVKNG